MKAQQQLSALQSVINAVLEAIEASGDRGLPSGHLYAMLMPFGCSLQQYEMIISILTEAKRITQSNHVLYAVKE